MDGRRLDLAQGCPSLFAYCTDVRHLSEHAACHRIAAARAMRRFPAIVTRLADGEVTLTTVCLMIPVLTVDNCEQLLASGAAQEHAGGRAPGRRYPAAGGRRDRDQEVAVTAARAARRHRRRHARGNRNSEAVPTSEARSASAAGSETVWLEVASPPVESIESAADGNPPDSSRLRL
jgi:hypothetical protein